jgi:hypothetical protein
MAEVKNRGPSLKELANRAGAGAYQLAVCFSLPGPVAMHPGVLGSPSLYWFLINHPARSRSKVWSDLQLWSHCRGVQGALS